MTVRIFQGVTTEGGRRFAPGTIVSDAEASVTEMLDWIEQGDAEALPSSGEDRGAARSQLSGRTVKALSDFCNRAAVNGWGYVWGGRGKVYDEAEKAYLYRMYRTSKYNYAYYYTTQWQRWKGANVCDCSGLFEAFSGINRTANSFYNRCTEKGKISTMPNERGILVFRYSGASKKMVHMGMYDGDGKAIESKDSASGVVKTVVAVRGWTHWGRAEFIDYSGQEPNPASQPAFVLGRLLRKQTPYLRGEDVQGVQKELVTHGFSVGKSGVDGIYGIDSYNAVRRFQQANGLTADGVVGKNTTAALGGLWRP